MKVALLQMDIALGDVAANRRKAEAMLAEGLARGAKLFVLPEMWTTGYKLAAIGRLAEPADGPTMALLTCVSPSCRGPSPWKGAGRCSSPPSGLLRGARTGGRSTSPGRSRTSCS